MRRSSIARLNPGISKWINPSTVAKSVNRSFDNGKVAAYRVTRHLTLAGGLAVYWILGITVFSQNLGSNVRFFNDDFDRVIYSQRGAWALDGLVPYRGVFSEYPHVATYILGAPYLAGSLDFAAYRAVFSLVMCFFLGATIVLLRRMLPGREWLAHLMLLPGPLYFTSNRFDIVASFFVLLAFWYLQKGRNAATGVCLGVAVLTKWYPVVLLPLCLSYVYRRDRRFGWPLLTAFAVTCVAIVLPSLVGAGLRAVLRPYAFHAGRGLEMVSLPALLHLYVVQWLGVTVPPRLVSILCLGGVLLAVGASVRARVDSTERVVSWSVVIIASALLVSTVWSPQWMLWLLPLMILSARTTGDVLTVVAYGVIAYLVFPLLHDGLQRLESIPVKVGALVIYGVLIRTVIVAHRTDTPRGESPRS
jgi:uncharacterized membrane protein